MIGFQKIKGRRFRRARTLEVLLPKPQILEFNCKEHEPPNPKPEPLHGQLADDRLYPIWATIAAVLMLLYLRRLYLVSSNSVVCVCPFLGACLSVGPWMKPRSPQTAHLTRDPSLKLSTQHLNPKPLLRFGEAQRPQRKKRRNPMVSTLNQTCPTPPEAELTDFDQVDSRASP